MEIGRDLRLVEHKRKICLLADPRFSGGTSSAVAQEILAMNRLSGAAIDVCWMETQHFKGREIQPKLKSALEEVGQDPNDERRWRRNISAHAIVLHNPAALKFDVVAPFRILCDRLIVVCHENFLRPGGMPGFDVEKVLRMIRASGYARQFVLAPISAWNRKTVIDWLDQHPHEGRHWTVAAHDWFNICNFETVAPPCKIRDRRGRVSRPGFEKFPSLADMHDCFPQSAECIRILGGDTLLLEPAEIPSHWDVKPFGAEPVEDFLKSIDIFVYFTNPRWRESFGRVIAEAISAGKLVITDPETALTFGSCVIGCQPQEVSACIENLLLDQSYTRDLIRQAQGDLAAFSTDMFLVRAHDLLLDETFKYDPV